MLLHLNTIIIWTNLWSLSEQAFLKYWLDKSITSRYGRSIQQKPDIEINHANMKWPRTVYLIHCGGKQGIKREFHSNIDGRLSLFSQVSNDNHRHLILRWYNEMSNVWKMMMSNGSLTRKNKLALEFLLLRKKNNENWRESLQMWHK